MLRIPVPGSFQTKASKTVALLLIYLIGLSPALAGVTISPSNGIVMTGADGIVMTGADGIVMTGADGYVTYGPNGIVMTGADGIVMTGADTFATPNSVRMTSADGANISHADGIVMTGADGIVMTGADGTTYTANSVAITLANGIVMTGADGIVMTGADGVQLSGTDGIVMTGADGIVMTGADTVQAVGLNGEVFSVTPNGLSFAGVTGIVMTGADGIVMTGADGIVMTGADGIVMTGADATTGLRSVDPELAVLLDQTVDDSSINAILVYYNLPTEADLAQLQSLGIAGGTRFRTLPMVVISGTRDQITAASHLPGIRSLYTNRTLTFNSEPEIRAATGVERTRRDQDLLARNSGLQPTGRNVTVAVLDTGIDSTHADLSGRVVKNIKLADTQSVGLGFNYPVNSETLANTDQVYGHGSFVAGVIGGSGSLSSGKYAGVAPGSKLVGLGAGDATLVYVLGGLDYLLSNPGIGVRVVNCSFSANTTYNTNDPVNVATKMLTDSGINVVFSAGNTGPGTHTLNPYAVAPWVVSVGATDTQGHLASFSSRGDFASPLFRPTLVAPGVNVVSLRGSGVGNVTGVTGLAGADAQKLSLTELPYYTTASGTSFSAPQVAGAIALMLEANPNLTPAEVKGILQRTATPLAGYYEHEVGAGMLNVHAAVLQAAFPHRRFTDWRFLNSAQVQFYNDPLTTFTGTVQPGTNSENTILLPENSLFAGIQIGWGPLLSVNDLSLQVYNSAGTLVGQSNTFNVIGLTGKQERVSLIRPVAGNWRVSVRNSLEALGTTQSFSGVLQVGRANYATMRDIGSLGPALREAIYQNIRTLTMQPIGANFRPELTATRADLARALVASGQVPQYLANQPLYPDVNDASTRLFVESAQSVSNGSIFPEALPGSSFRPNDGVTRLAAAVALVRAAGLRSEAEAKAGAPLAFLDASTIPSDLRGYVSLAISKGLLQSDALFRPQNPLTRGELAQAIANMEVR